MEKLDYLEEERQKIWQCISKLKEDIKKKTSDYEDDAKQASARTAEFKNKSEVIFTQIKSYEDNVKQNYEEVTTLHKNIKDIEPSLKEKIEYIEQQHTTISKNEKTCSPNVEALESMFKDLDDLKAKVENLNKLSVKGVETSDKIDLLLKSATEKRNEINKIHLEIDGFSEVDEDGEAVGYVPGLKDKLKNSYDEIEKKVISLQKQLDGIINQTILLWKH